jgi:hypothetical protein
MVAEVTLGALGMEFSSILPIVATCFLILDFVLSARRRSIPLRSLTARTHGYRLPRAGEYFLNGKQDVDRRLPPGGNACRRGAGQPD